jgi:hypothetical protein
MELVSNEVFALVVPGYDERVRLRVQQCRDGTYAIRAEPDKGDIGESESLAAMAVIADILRDRRYAFRILERNTEDGNGSPVSVVDSVVIPGCEAALVRQLLQAVAGMPGPVVH